MIVFCGISCTPRASFPGSQNLDWWHTSSGAARVIFSLNTKWIMLVIWEQAVNFSGNRRQPHHHFGSPRYSRHRDVFIQLYFEHKPVVLIRIRDHLNFDNDAVRFLLGACCVNTVVSTPSGAVQLPAPCCAVRWLSCSCRDNAMIWWTLWVEMSSFLTRLNTLAASLRRNIVDPGFLLEFFFILNSTIK